MALKFLGKKEGMTQVYDENGKLITCSVIFAEPNVVSQLKSHKTDGYNAIQLAAFKVKPPKVKNVTKAMIGHFKKGGISPRKALQESRMEKIDGFEVGQEIDANYFAEVTHVDVTGVSKGKGFQGVIKRHGFKGGPGSHGSGFHRHAGSTGMRTTPGRCLPGVKMAGRMGGEKVTVQNKRIVKIDAEKKIILVEGSIPGARGGIVTVRQAIKMKPAKK